MSEIIILGSKHQRQKVNMNGFVLSVQSFHTTDKDRNFGTMFDADMSLNHQISSTSKPHFFILFSSLLY